MTIKVTSELTDSQKDELLKLWNSEYPEQLKHQSREDFDKYLAGVENHKHFLLFNDDGFIQGWHFQFKREGETWFGMIIASELHGKGFGSKLLNEGKKEASKLSGWVIDHTNYLKSNGDPYPSPLAFYLKNGFEVLPDIRPKDGKISGLKVVWKSLDH